MNEPGMAEDLMNPFIMLNRTVLVTGASSGIGRETSLYLSKLGTRVVLVARNRSRLEEVAAGLQGTGHVIEAFDLSGVDEMPSWMKDIASRHGPLDGIVHCAGRRTTRPINFWNSSQSDVDIRINVSSCFALAKSFRQKGVHADRASIVFLASVLGLAGGSGTAVYSATKGAVIALTRSLAVELAREGIRVNCVAPGLVRTSMMEDIQKNTPASQFEEIVRMHPLGVGEPVDVAAAIAFLLSQTGRWITGSVLVVDGGYTAA